MVARAWCCAWMKVALGLRVSFKEPATPEIRRDVVAQGRRAPRRARLPMPFGTADHSSWRSTAGRVVHRQPRGLEQQLSGPTPGARVPRCALFARRPAGPRRLSVARYAPPWAAPAADPAHLRHVSLAVRGIPSLGATAPAYSGRCAPPAPRRRPTRRLPRRPLAASRARRRSRTVYGRQHVAARAAASLARSRGTARVDTLRTVVLVWVIASVRRRRCRREHREASPLLGASRSASRHSPIVPGEWPGSSPTTSPRLVAPAVPADLFDASRSPH